MAEELVELELMLNRFRRLMAEVMRGVTRRNSFLRWELEILLDLETCELERRRRLEILRQYQRAVERQLQSGPGPPMKMSEFLRQRAERAALFRVKAPKSRSPGSPTPSCPEPPP